MNRAAVLLAGAALLAGPAARAADPALALLAFEDGPVPGGAARLRAVAVRLLEAPSARGLAAEFAAEGARLRVAFHDFEGGRVETRGGRPTLQGAPTGRFDSEDARGPVVLISRLFLELPPSAQDLAIAETLAHEWLGHFTYMRRAERAGLAQYQFHRDDEMRARLIAAIAALELGGAPYHAPDPRDMAESYRYLVRRTPHYALSLSAAEMADPSAALSRRLNLLRFMERRAEIGPSSGDELERIRVCLDAVRRTLDPGMEPWFEALRRESSDPFYAALEEEVLGLTARLAVLAPAAPAPAGADADDDRAWRELRGRTLGW